MIARFSCPVTAAGFKDNREEERYSNAAVRRVHPSNAAAILHAWRTLYFHTIDMAVEVMALLQPTISESLPLQFDVARPKSLCSVVRDGPSN